ncbi:Uncharacterised protein [Acinetobacter baumannii]|nr:Uncharacterised protein [Acinetobacter baumannii]
MRERGLRQICRLKLSRALAKRSSWSSRSLWMAPGLMPSMCQVRLRLNSTSSNGQGNASNNCRARSCSGSISVRPKYRVRVKPSVLP